MAETIPTTEASDERTWRGSLKQTVFGVCTLGDWPPTWMPLEPSACHTCSPWRCRVPSNCTHSEKNPPVCLLHRWIWFLTTISFYFFTFKRPVFDISTYWEKQEFSSRMHESMREGFKWGNTKLHQMKSPTQQNHRPIQPHNFLRNAACSKFATASSFAARHRQVRESCGHTAWTGPWAQEERAQTSTRLAQLF